jgi:hypothetical protein
MNPLKSIQKIFTGPLGTFIKAFIVGVLLMMYKQYKVNNTICFDVDCLQDFIIAAFGGTIPFIINWVNPQYQEYGPTNKGEHD